MSEFMFGRSGTKVIRSFEKDEAIVSMIQFQDRILLATSKRVFVYDPSDLSFKQLELVVKE